MPKIERDVGRRDVSAKGRPRQNAVSQRTLSRGLSGGVKRGLAVCARLLNRLGRRSVGLRSGKLVHLALESPLPKP